MLDDSRLDPAAAWLRRLDWFTPEPGLWVGDANANFLNLLAAAWPESLAAGLPVCVAGSGEAFEQLAEHAPERFAELKAKVYPDLPAAVDLCCGAYREREDALMPAESQLWNLTAARAAVKKLFGW